MLVLCVALVGAVDGGPSVAVLMEGTPNGDPEVVWCSIWTQEVHFSTCATTVALRFDLPGVDRIILMKKRVDSVSNNIIVRV